MYERHRIIGFLDFAHRKHNVSGTASASVFRREEEDTYSAGFLQKGPVTGLVLSKGPNRICVSLLSLEGENKSSFQNVVCFLFQSPLSLVSTIEELLERNSSGSGLENRYYGRRGDPPP
jgi:hypothetical protein